MNTMQKLAQKIIAEGDKKLLEETKRITNPCAKKKRIRHSMQALSLSLDNLPFDRIYFQL